MQLIPAELDVGTEEVEGIARDVSPASMSSTVNLLEVPTERLGTLFPLVRKNLKKVWYQIYVLIPSNLGPVKEMRYGQSFLRKQTMFEEVNK